MRSTASSPRPLVLTLLAMSGAACDRTPEAKPDSSMPVNAPAPVSEAPPASAVASPAPAASGAMSNSDYRLPALSRVVAIGDVHGDLNALRAALKLAGAIDGDDNWIGKGLSIVQVGDQLDRGDQDREVLDVLEKLEVDARAAGGALHVLNGNHEFMNVDLDFRYVTEKSFKSFEEFSQRAPELSARLPAQARGRAAAFAPGAPYALKLSKHLTVALVGDSLFAHAGVLPAHFDYGLSRINAEASSFLAGQRPALPPILAGDDAPIWTRAYGGPEVEPATCQGLERVLQQAGAKRLVVGHTVQKDGISSACQNKLFRIDVGLAAYYGDNPPQVLEITAAGARIVKAVARGSAATDVTRGKSAPRDPAVHSAP